jgi:uncharacterized membrane protein
VNAGLSSDTAGFAVESLNRWRDLIGYKYYKDTKLQELANRIDKKITVLHFPPGTSKWNKIEYRLFSFISKNWREKPLISTAVLINLISSTKTGTGLRVECVLDNNIYRMGIKVAEEEYEAINNLALKGEVCCSRKAAVLRGLILF